MSDGRLNYEITGDASGFNRAAQSAMAAGSRLTNQVAQFAGGLGFGLGLNRLADITSGAVDAAVEFDALKQGLAAVSAEGEDLAVNLARVQRLARLPGLGFIEALQGVTNLRAVNFTMSESEGILSAFGNALATVGKGKAELDGVITALSQMATKGKVSAEEIGQIAERVPQIRTAMQAAFGTADTEALQKMGISATQFVAGIVTELSKLKPVSGGIKNELENVNDELARMSVSIGSKLAPAKLLAMQMVSGTLQGFGQLFNEMSTGMTAAESANGSLIARAMEGFRAARAEHDRWNDSFTETSRRSQQASDDIADALARQSEALRAYQAQVGASNAKPQGGDASPSKTLADIFPTNVKPNREELSKTIQEIEKLQSVLAGSNSKSQLRELNIAIDRMASGLGVNSARDVMNDTGRFSAEQIKKAQDLAALEVQRKQLQSQIADEAKREADQAARTRKEKADAFFDARRQLNLYAQSRGEALAEVAIDEAKARGQTRKAERLERELRLQQLIAQYKRDLNASDEQALSLAQRKVDAEEAQANGGRRRIRGYSQSRESFQQSQEDFRNLNDAEAMRKGPGVLDKSRMNTPLLDFFQKLQDRTTDAFPAGPGQPNLGERMIGRGTAAARSAAADAATKDRNAADNVKTTANNITQMAAVVKELQTLNRAFARLEAA